MRRLRERPMAGLVVVSTISVVIGLAICLAIDWFPTQASTAADDIDLLYDVLLIASVPIFVLVMSVAIYSVVIFRAKPGDMSDGEPIHGNTTLEIVWVTIPFVLVSVLAIYGWVVLDDIEAKQPNTMVVDVKGRQFTWSYEYPGEGRVKSTELVLPKDRPVEFRVKTDDVLHSFWVPEFRLKTDAVPGLTTKIRVTPNRIGSYDVVCAELCGLGHSAMRGSVRVVSPAEFDDWVAKRSQRAADGGASANGGDMAAAGKALFTDTGCDSCHTLSDAGSDAEVGPNLDNVAASARENGRGKSAEEYVKQSIESPNAVVVKGFNKGVMPGNYGEQLSPEELDTLVKYLLEMGGGKSK